LLKTHKVIKIKRNLGIKITISMSPFHKGFVLNQFANAKNVKGMQELHHLDICTNLKLDIAHLYLWNNYYIAPFSC
jgi:hypothetical protein